MGKGWHFAPVDITDMDVVAFLKGDWEAQLMLSATATERFPSHPAPYNLRALAQAALGQFDECIDSARRATRHPVGPASGREGSRVGAPSASRARRSVSSSSTARTAASSG